MAQVLFDNDTQLQLDAGLKAAATATDKYTVYSTTILGALTNPILHAVTDLGVDIVIGQLTTWTRVGQILRITGQTVSGTSPDDLVAADISHYLLVSGTRWMRIDEPYLTLTGTIPTGAFTCIVGPIDVTMPNFGVDQSGGGGGTVFTPGAPPGSGWTTVLAATDTEIVVPNYFVGSHRWLSLGAAPYSYATHRSHDARGTSALPSGTDDSSLLWARLHTGRYTYNRAAVDDWISQTSGKTRVFTFFGTPTWARKYTDTATGRGVKYNTFPDAASAPADMAYITEFFTWLYSIYTVAQIPFVEVWNEPSFGAYGSTYSPPTTTNRWTDPGNQLGGDACFFNGTAIDHKNMAQAVRAAVPVGVTVLGCGFEIGSDPTPYGIDTRNINAFLAAGGFAFVNGLSFHSYMYSNNPSIVTTVGAGVKAWRVANGLSAMPQYNTETGHENPGPASNYSTVQLAATTVREYVRSAANGDKMFCVYQDRGSASRQTMGNPAIETEIATALTEVYNKLNGQTLRQISTNADGRVWARNAGNNEIIG